MVALAATVVLAATAAAAVTVVLAALVLELETPVQALLVKAVLAGDPPQAAPMRTGATRMPDRVTIPRQTHLILARQTLLPIRP